MAVETKTEVTVVVLVVVDVGRPTAVTAGSSKIIVSVPRT